MDIKSINALLDGSATIETIIEVLPQDATGDVLRLTNEDSIQSWEHSELRYVPDKGFVGTFVERSLEGVLHNISEDFNIENRELVLYLGIRRYVADIAQEDLTKPAEAHSIVSGTDSKLGDYVTTFYSLGNFIVDKPDSDEVKDNTQFTAKDYTVKFNIPFDADFTDSEFTKSFTEMLSEGTKPTALWLVKYTCKQAGVELATEDFVNNDFEIDSNQFQSGDYCRDVLKHIGQLAYSWVRVGWDNKVYIDFNVKDDVEQEYNNISKDNYYSLEVQKEKYGAINKVVLASSTIEGDYSYNEDSDAIALDGEKILTIYDNPILYTEDLRTLAVAKSDVLFGLKYTPLTIETTGHPWLKGTDLISTVDKNDNVIYTYPFDRIIKYNGHIRTVLSSYAQTQIEEDYHYEGTGSTQNQIKQTKVTVDRQNQQISLVASKVEGYDSQLASMKLETDKIETIVSKTDTLSNTIDDLSNSFDDFVPQSEFDTLTTSVQNLQTDTYSKTDINKIISGTYTDENGQEVTVTKVQTVSGTFDENGMHYEKTDAPTSATINEKGVTVEDSTTTDDLLYAGYVDKDKIEENASLEDFEGQTVVYSENSVVNRFFSFAGVSRLQAYSEEVDGEVRNGAGFFYIGE